MRILKALSHLGFWPTCLNIYKGISVSTTALAWFSNELLLLDEAVSNSHRGFALDTMAHVLLGSCGNTLLVPMGAVGVYQILSLRLLTERTNM